MTTYPVYDCACRDWTPDFGAGARAMMFADAIRAAAAGRAPPAPLEG